MDKSLERDLFNLTADVTTGKNDLNDVKNEKFFENKIESKWLTSKEVAQYLAISENALRIMVHRGQIPYYKFGRRLRFQFEDCMPLIRKIGV
ncbi:MAG: helix-turn-helix domain-containing protein [Pseudobdellovibrio sp.]